MEALHGPTKICTGGAPGSRNRRNLGAGSDRVQASAPDEGGGGEGVSKGGGVEVGGVGG